MSNSIKYNGLNFEAKVTPNTGSPFVVSGVVWAVSGMWYASVMDYYHGEGETKEAAVNSVIADFMDKVLTK